MRHEQNAGTASALVSPKFNTNGMVPDPSALQSGAVTVQ